MCIVESSQRKHLDLFWLQQSIEHNQITLKKAPKTFLNRAVWIILFSRRLWDKFMLSKYFGKNPSYLFTKEQKRINCARTAKQHDYVPHTIQNYCRIYQKKETLLIWGAWYNTPMQTKIDKLKNIASRNLRHWLIWTNSRISNRFQLTSILCLISNSWIAGKLCIPLLFKVRFKSVDR